MPKIDLTRATAIKASGGVIEAMKGIGFRWDRLRGFAYLTDATGEYLTDARGNYFIVSEI